MRIVHGGTTGLVKVWSCTVGEAATNDANTVREMYGTQASELEVTAMSWLSQPDCLALARINGQIDIVDLLESENDRKDDEAALKNIYRDPNSKSSKVVGLSAWKVGNNGDDEGYRVCYARSDGHLEIASYESNGYKTLRTLQAGRSIAACTFSSDTIPSVCAIGGEEQDLVIWDVEAGEARFRARNVALNSLHIRVPVWIRAIEFVPNTNQQRVITGTAYHQVRVYDIKSADRRPVMDVDVGEHTVTSICALQHEHNAVVVADGAGKCRKLDMRANLKCIGAFKGHAGAIRTMVSHPKRPLLVTAGLDRFIRVYNSRTRNLVKRQYAKHSVNCMLLTERNPSSNEIGAVDDVWDALDRRTSEKRNAGDDTDCDRDLSKRHCGA